MMTSSNRALVFVDSTKAGIRALSVARNRGLNVVFIQPRRGSFLDASHASDSERAQIHNVATEVIEVEAPRRGAVEAALATLDTRYKVVGITTTTEPALEVVAEVATARGLSSIKPAALKKAIYKDTLRRVLSEAGLRSPVCRRLSLVSTRDEIALAPVPCVLKPTRGYGKEGTFICDSHEEIADALDRARQYHSEKTADSIIADTYIADSYIAGELFSAETIVQRGEVRLYETARRFRNPDTPLLEVAAMIPSGLARDEALVVEKEMSAVCAALGIDHGLFHIEFIRNPEGIWVVEINARMMGSVTPHMYEILYAHSPYEYLIDVAMGRWSELPRACPQTGITVALGGLECSALKKPSTAEIRDLIRSCSVKLTTLPDEVSRWSIPKYVGNLSVVGHAVIVTDDRDETVAVARRFVSSLSDLSGVKFAQF